MWQVRLSKLTEWKYMALATVWDILVYKYCGIFSFLLSRGYISDSHCFCQQSHYDTMFWLATFVEMTAMSYWCFGLLFFDNFGQTQEWLERAMCYFPPELSPLPKLPPYLLTRLEGGNLRILVRIGNPEVCIESFELKMVNMCLLLYSVAHILSEILNNFNHLSKCTKTLLCKYVFTDYF